MRNTAVSLPFGFVPCSQNSTRQHFRLDQEHILRASQVAAAGEPGHVAQHGDNQPHTGRFLNGAQRLPYKPNAANAIDANAQSAIAPITVAFTRNNIKC